MIELHDYDFDNMAQDAHATAKNKGWWGPDKDNPERRSVSDQTNNFHAELSEAWEEWRDGRGIRTVYESEGGKPEGFPVELADLLIRLGDTSARYDFRVNSSIRIAVRHTRGVAYISTDSDSQDVSDFVAAMHKALAILWQNMKALHVNPSAERTSLGNIELRRSASSALALCVITVLSLCERAEIDIGEAIERKMAYNTTRPHRHGGKRA